MRLNTLKRAAHAAIDLGLAPVLIVAALLSRFASRPFDVGLGPEPLVNNVYHKRALEGFGYRARTFANSIYYVTQEFDRKLILPRSIGYLSGPLLFLHAIRSDSCPYFFFPGGGARRR